MAYGKGNETESCAHCLSILHEGEIEILSQKNHSRSNYWVYVTARNREVLTKLEIFRLVKKCLVLYGTGTTYFRDRNSQSLLLVLRLTDSFCIIISYLFQIFLILSSKIQKKSKLIEQCYKTVIAYD
jgi:hypothetical protein